MLNFGTPPFFTKTVPFFAINAKGGGAEEYQWLVFGQFCDVSYRWADCE